jgi:site-specific recombinase XerD
MNLQLLIEQYITHRRSLGESQGSNGRALRAFGRAIGAGADIADVRGEQVDAFLVGTGPITLNWHIKHGTLRAFYHYAVSRGYVATAPLPAVIPKRPPPFAPYIFSREDLRRLFQAADSDPHRHACLEPVTMRTTLLLLYGAGLRVREAVDLNHADVDLDGSLLTVHESKFGKTRLVPFGPQLGSSLARYATRVRPSAAEAPFFTTRAGARVKTDTLRHNYRLLCERAGVRREDGARYQPRLHDLRHTFAVHRLTSWYRQGADVQRLLPHLSVYLGHVHIRTTQVYLSMTPELLQEANLRFERYAGKEDVDA